MVFIDEGGKIIEIVKFLNNLVKEALIKSASDIHFSKSGEVVKIYFRINGLLIPKDKITIIFYNQLIRYLKYQSGMDLNICKTPQSSSLDVIIENKVTRLRLSTLPTSDFESFVVRLNNRKIYNSLKNLFLYPNQYDVFKDITSFSNGLIVISGPTNSGKTTLVYNLLDNIKNENKNIITLEDPVEAIRDGIVQLQVNEASGVSYDNSIKEVLRHDPDVIMIGEIRDENTAKSVIRAALSGHLVITTVHSKDAISAIYRLLEFGVSLSELQQTIRFISNQRLVVSNNEKKIVTEFLDETKIEEAIRYITEGVFFSYNRIVDYIINNDEIEVIK